MMSNNFYTLCKKLGQLCIKRSMRIALAESCTGGMLSALITDVTGSSQWFNGSAVVYSNPAKSNLLGVDDLVIKNHGAVSEVVAKAMAQGAQHAFHANIALSITGVAGPLGGTVEKPVGMVCFALADKDSVESKTMHFTSGRHAIRQNATLFALEWLVMHLSIQ